MVYQNKMMKSGEDKFENKTRKCVEPACQKIFDWSASEQEWFRKQGLKYPPQRCVDCRRKRRQKKLTGL